MYPTLVLLISLCRKVELQSNLLRVESLHDCMSVCVCVCITDLCVF